MPDWAQIISDALDILKFDGAVQDTLAELREKWGAQVPALLDERFDAVGVQYMKLSHEKGAAALGQELSAYGWALYNLDDEDEYLFALIPEEERSEWDLRAPFFSQFRQSVLYGSVKFQNVQGIRYDLCPVWHKSTPSF